MKTIVFSMVLFSISAFAGVMNGGGGKGVVCSAADGTVQSVELLDLWEARTLFGENPSFKVPGVGLEQAVFLILEKLKESYPYKATGKTGDLTGCIDQECLFRNLLGEARFFLTPNTRVVRLHDVSLELTADSYEVAKPSTCEIQQIVNYQPSGKILINQDLFDKLDFVNQVALISHEAYYSVLRSQENESNSIRTRRAIGHVISGKNFTLSTPAVPNDHILCYNEGVPYAPTQLIVYFQKSSSLNSGGLTIYPILSGGSEYIGLQDRLISGPMFDISGPIFDEKKYSSLVSGQCDKDGLFYIMGFQMSGPVEFDHNSNLEWICKNGALTAYFNDRKPGQQMTSVPLTCRVHK